MIKWKSANIPEEVQEEISKIPGAYLKDEWLFASDDLKETLTRLIGHVPTYERVVRRKVDTAKLSPILFPWQRECAIKLATGEKSAAYHHCGLGKTATCISAALLLEVKKVLIITRSMGRDVYARDLKKLGIEKRVSILMGLGKEGKALSYAIRRYNKYLSRYPLCAAYGKVADAPEDTWITVCPWEILHAHVENLKNLSWDIIIFDEHHMGKGRLAKRTDAAIELSKCSKVKWSLTATPVRDRLRDLWAQWKAIDFYGAGSSWTWCMRYCNMRPGRYGGMDSNGTSNVEELKERIAYLADIKTREEIRHLLPGKMRNTIRISPMGKVDEKTYEYGKRGIEAAIAAAANIKMDDVVERCVDALCGREKVVLVGNRREWVPKIWKKIKDEVERIPALRDKVWIRWTTGEASVGDRQVLSAEYQKLEGPAILIGTSDSLGESIDLHQSDRLIVAALPYTSGQLTQLEGRCARIGGRPVTIDFLVAEGTIDEQIEDSLLSKLVAIEQAGVNTDLGTCVGHIDDDEVMGDLDKWLKENTPVA